MEAGAEGEMTTNASDPNEELKILTNMIRMGTLDLQPGFKDEFLQLLQDFNDVVKMNTCKMTVDQGHKLAELLQLNESSPTVGKRNVEASKSDTDETILHKSDQNSPLLQGYGWAEEANLQTYDAVNGKFQNDNGRLQNQDAYAMKYINTTHGPVFFAAIMDGHGGMQCSEYVAEEMPNILTQKLNKVLNLDERNVTNALINTFIETNHRYYKYCFEGKVQKTANIPLNVQARMGLTDGADWNLNHPYLQMGTCCCAVLITEQGMFTANVGDSRAVAEIMNCGCRSLEELTTDHTVETESARIEAVAHKINDKQPFLSNQQGKRYVKTMWATDKKGKFLINKRRTTDKVNTGRSIGDVAFKDLKDDNNSYIQCTPDVETFATSQNNFAIIACDGVWDTKGLDTKSALTIVRDVIIAEFKAKRADIQNQGEENKDKPTDTAIALLVAEANTLARSAAQKLVTEAKEKGSTDNISAIVLIYDLERIIRMDLAGSHKSETTTWDGVDCKPISTGESDDIIHTGIPEKELKMHPDYTRQNQRKKAKNDKPSWHTKEHYYTCEDDDPTTCPAWEETKKARTPPAGYSDWDAWSKHSIDKDKNNLWRPRGEEPPPKNEDMNPVPWQYRYEKITDVEAAFKKVGYKIVRQTDTRSPRKLENWWKQLSDVRDDDLCFAFYDESVLLTVAAREEYGCKATWYPFTFYNRAFHDYNEFKAKDVVEMYDDIKDNPAKQWGIVYCKHEVKTTHENEPVIYPVTNEVPCANINDLAWHFMLAVPDRGNQVEVDEEEAARQRKIAKEDEAARNTKAAEDPQTHATFDQIKDSQGEPVDVSLLVKAFDYICSKSATFKEDADKPKLLEFFKQQAKNHKGLQTDFQKGVYTLFEGPLKKNQFEQLFGNKEFSIAQKNKLIALCPDNSKSTHETFFNQILQFGSSMLYKNEQIMKKSNNQLIVSNIVDELMHDKLLRSQVYVILVYYAFFQF